MLPGQAVSSSVLQIVGIAYGSTAVNWGSFVREVFKEHFHRNTRKKLSGIVELDESLFGKKNQVPPGKSTWRNEGTESITNVKMYFIIHAKVKIVDP